MLGTRWILRLRIGWGAFHHGNEYVSRGSGTTTTSMRSTRSTFSIASHSYSLRFRGESRSLETVRHFSLVDVTHDGQTKAVCYQYGIPASSNEYLPGMRFPEDCYCQTPRRKA